MVIKKINSIQIQKDFLTFLQAKGLNGSVGISGNTLIVGLKEPKKINLPKVFKGYKVEVRKIY